MTGCIEEEGESWYKLLGPGCPERTPGPERVACVLIFLSVRWEGRKVKVKVKFILEQATKAQRESRGIVILFL
jgi:hypothetical protein